MVAEKRRKAILMQLDEKMSALSKFFEKVARTHFNAS
jgi:hypothetical protein